jgi:hypothetical protein
VLIRDRIPRYIIINTGSIRFDLVKGPFTYDDSFIVSPFDDAFQFIASVPYDMARKVLASLNGAALPDKRDTPGPIYGSMPILGSDACPDPGVGPISGELKPRGIIRRQTVTTNPGYLTTDDFGSDGDDTPHSKIPSYSQPNYIQGNGSFPATGNPEFVDVVFLDYFASVVVQVLNGLGGAYTINDVGYYMERKFTTNSYLPLYAQQNWQANVPNCPVGQGVGFPDKA